MLSQILAESKDKEQSFNRLIYSAEAYFGFLAAAGVLA